jgi:hypothetical protein
MPSVEKRPKFELVPHISSKLAINFFPVSLKLILYQWYLLPGRALDNVLLCYDVSLTNLNVTRGGQILFIHYMDSLVMCRQA